MYQIVFDYVESQIDELNRLRAIEAQLRNGRRNASGLGFRLRENSGNALIALGKRLKPQAHVVQGGFVHAQQSSIRSR